MIFCRESAVKVEKKTEGVSIGSVLRFLGNFLGPWSFLATIGDPKPRLFCSRNPLHPLDHNENDVVGRTKQSRQGIQIPIPQRQKSRSQTHYTWGPRRETLCVLLCAEEMRTWDVRGNQGKKIPRIGVFCKT